MSARQTSIPVVASLALVGAAAVALTGMSLRHDSPAAGTPPAVSEAPVEAPATTAAPFPDAATASLAAESLIAPYIQSQYALAVTDVACSNPPTGAQGEQFVCYALQPGDLVVALRATIDADSVIDLTPITPVGPTTTEPVPSTP